MNQERLTQTLELIDAYNRDDPNLETHAGETVAREWLYGQRMSAWLQRMYPDASEIQQIAARAQHIGRWKIPRDQYEKNRVGYLEWRTRLYSFHADLAAEIMQKTGYDADSINQVKKILKKRGLRKEPDSQSIEDVACLVFLESYFLEFVHDYGDEDKIVSIVQKTWKKMSPTAHQAALRLDLPPAAAALVQKALQA